MQTRTHLKGVIYASLAGIFWGMAGIASEYLFQDQHVSVYWMMGVKMSLSALTLLGLAYYLDGKKIFLVFKSFKDILGIVLFSILGLAGVQFTYSMTVNYSNATVATIIQTLGILPVIFYSATIFKQLPGRKQWIATITALIGAWLLVTKGSFNQLAISKEAIIWGIFLMLTQAGNSVLPVDLLRRHNPTTISAWAMLVGGIVFEFIHPVWKSVPKFTPAVTLNMLFLIFIGTALSYYLFVKSLHLISATEATLLDTFEPLTAALLDFLIFKMQFNWAEILGSLLVISTVFILAVGSEENENSDPQKEPLK